MTAILSQPQGVKSSGCPHLILLFQQVFKWNIYLYRSFTRSWATPRRPINSLETTRQLCRAWHVQNFACLISNFNSFQKRLLLYIEFRKNKLPKSHLPWPMVLLVQAIRQWDMLIFVINDWGKLLCYNDVQQYLTEDYSPFAEYITWLCLRKYHRK